MVSGTGVVLQVYIFAQREVSCHILKHATSIHVESRYVVVEPAAAERTVSAGNAATGMSKNS